MSRAKKKKTGRRDYKTNLVIGGKGQGKSTLIRDMIDEYIAAYTPVYQKQGIYPRVFVHDFSSSRAFRDIMTIEQAIEHTGVTLEHPMDFLSLKDAEGKPVWQKGILRYVCQDEKDVRYMHKSIAKHFRNGLAVFDEWTTYIKPNPSDWQKLVVNNHRNWGLEVLLVCHQIMLVPNFFVRGDQVGKIILFKTKERHLDFNQIRKKYSCADDLWDALQRVTKAPEQDTFVQYHEIIEV